MATNDPVTPGVSTISGTAQAFWLTEEKPDKHRRRRSCLGCGETQEYFAKDSAPSFVVWWKLHQACRPAESFDVAAPLEPGIVQVPSVEAPPLSECAQCGFAGVDLTESGVCRECEEGMRGGDSLKKNSLKKIEAIDADPRIQAFITRTGCSYEEVQQMIGTGQITLRGPQGELTAPKQDTVYSWDYVYTVGMRVEARRTVMSGWVEGTVTKLRSGKVPADPQAKTVQVQLDGYKNPCYPDDIRLLAAQTDGLPQTGTQEAQR